MEFNILALVAAGKVTEDDDVLALMQNISAEHAHSIADWLCLATGGPVVLRCMGVGGSVFIEQTPEGLAAKIKKVEL